MSRPGWVSFAEPVRRGGGCSSGDPNTGSRNSADDSFESGVCGAVLRLRLSPIDEVVGLFPEAGPDSSGPVFLFFPGLWYAGDGAGVVLRGSRHGRDSVSEMRQSRLGNQEHDPQRGLSRPVPGMHLRSLRPDDRGPQGGVSNSRPARQRTRQRSRFW